MQVGNNKPVRANQVTSGRQQIKLSPYQHHLRKLRAEFEALSGEDLRLLLHAALDALSEEDLRSHLAQLLGKGGLPLPL